MLHFMTPQLRNKYENLIYLQPRQDNPFTFMHVAFLVLGYMLALFIIFCFTFARIFQLATIQVKEKDHNVIELQGRDDHG